MQYKVQSEIGPLRLVITHKPGIEHQYVTPNNLIEKIQEKNALIDNPNYLLFDDIIQVNKAQQEHQELYDILHYFTDGNCYEFIDILKVVLENNSLKNQLIDECCLLEEEIYKNVVDKNILHNIDNSTFINVLLSGYYKEQKIFTHPIPNLIFTRDISVCIGNTILITWKKRC